MKEFITNSPEETEAIGEKLASYLMPGTVVAFFGGLGMGKTTFTRGLAKGLGATEYVSSPTFSLVNEYGGNPPLAHFDMYRIDSWEDLFTTGFFDYIDSGYVLSVEWSENIENALPEDTVYVHFSKGEDMESRIIKIEGGCIE